MATQVFIINGRDFSRFVVHGGLSWARNALDSSKSGRTKDGKMRRVVITQKRSLRYELHGMSRNDLATLDELLSAETAQVTYMDVHGQQTREFYCSTLKADLNTTTTDGPYGWGAATFTLTEV